MAPLNQRIVVAPPLIMQRNRKYTGALCLLFAGLWIILGEAPRSTFQRLSFSREITRAYLKKNDMLLQNYLQRFGEVPPSFNELRLFADAMNRPFYPYDAYGERFDYLRLGKNHYVIRSFGEGSEEDSSDRPEISIVRSPSLPRRGLKQFFPTTLKLANYPAVLLLGSDSPAGSWNAQLFIDPVQGTRRLLVRPRILSATKQFLAPHDGVEEFLWLPDGKRLVYTASSSNLYRDGIYLWDFEKKSASNLLDVIASMNKLSPSSRAQNWLMSLAGVTSDGPQVSVFLAQDFGGGIAPAEFYAAGNLWTFSLPYRGRPTATANATANLKAQLELLQRRYLLSAQLYTNARGTRMQQKWMRLPLKGRLQNLLEGWQDYTARTSSRNLLPYAMWVLANIYGQASEKVSGRDREILRSYGMEISKGLIELPLAPRYLRALGIFEYQALAQGQKVPLQIVEFTP